MQVPWDDEFYMDLTLIIIVFMFFHVIYNLFSLGILHDQVHLVVVICFWV
jgi:hypothetical protein